MSERDSLRFKVRQNISKVLRISWNLAGDECSAASVPVTRECWRSRVDEGS